MPEPKVLKAPPPKAQETPKPTIPVQIDSIKRLGDFQRTRCIYYRVEHAVELLLNPSPLSSSGRGSFITWVGWEVLTGSGRQTGGSDLFDSADLIDQVLGEIEEDENLFLDLGHIWLPNELLGVDDAGESVRAGDIYRLPADLFYQCYRFVADAITEQEWLDACRAGSEGVVPSPQETAAIREWRQRLIKRSSDRYHSDDYATRRLPKKEGVK